MKTILVALFFLLNVTVYAQRIRLVEGNIQLLKGMKNISARVTYDSLVVGAEFPESTFVETKRKAWDVKEAGKGDKWVEYWNESKSRLYGPTFAYIFAKNAGIKLDKEAPYTLILRTKQIEPGWNGGPMGGPAFIIGEVWMVDSADESKVIAKFTLQKVKGDDATGGDFEMGRRIQQAYTNAAKHLGTYFKEKVI